MEDKNRKKRPGRPKGSGTDSPELRVVAIHCNPAPDAQDRLRRLFTLLLEHTAESAEDAPAEDPPAADHAGEDA